MFHILWHMRGVSKCCQRMPRNHLLKTICVAWWALAWTRSENAKLDSFNSNFNWDQLRFSKFFKFSKFSCRIVNALSKHCQMTLETHLSYHIVSLCTSNVASRCLDGIYGVVGLFEHFLMLSIFVLHEIVNSLIGCSLPRLAESFKLAQHVSIVCQTHRSKAFSPGNSAEWSDRFIHSYIYMYNIYIYMCVSISLSLSHYHQYLIVLCWPGHKSSIWRTLFSSFAKPCQFIKASFAVPRTCRLSLDVRCLSLKLRFSVFGFWGETNNQENPLHGKELDDDYDDWWFISCHTRQ